MTTFCCLSSWESVQTSSSSEVLLQKKKIAICLHSSPSRWRLLPGSSLILAYSRSPRSLLNSQHPQLDCCLQTKHGKYMYHLLLSQIPLDSFQSSWDQQTIKPRFMWIWMWTGPFPQPQVQIWLCSWNYPLQEPILLSCRVLAQRNSKFILGIFPRVFLLFRKRWS